MSDSSDQLRKLPSVDALLRTEEGRRLTDEYAPGFVAAEARALVARWRAGILAGDGEQKRVADELENAGQALAAAVIRAVAPSLVPVVNATGVVVHTNLGRAPWPRRAIDRAVEAAAGYSNLEYNLNAGKRGKRESHIARAKQLFGAEAALVVNNNAAAVFLVVNTLAEGKETVVSRGELVEIGGSFRVPEILRKSGSRLREVGTTNRTHLRDYEEAIGDETGILLRVHPSNYRVIGFTATVAVNDLANLGRERGIPVVEDLGSGQAVDLDPAGVPDEPTVASSLAAGIDLVTFSGDKLLGGPQAGIIVGKKDLVDRLAANPLYRALRPDKVTIAALDELLLIYGAGEPWKEVPVLAALGQDPATIEKRSGRLAEELRLLGYGASLIEGSSAVGGGAAPEVEIPSRQLAVTHQTLTANDIERGLRRHRPPIIARIIDDAVVIDLRTVLPAEEASLTSAFASVVERP